MLVQARSVFGERIVDGSDNGQFLEINDNLFGGFLGQVRRFSNDDGEGLANKACHIVRKHRSGQALCSCVF